MTLSRRLGVWALFASSLLANAAGAEEAPNETGTEAGTAPPVVGAHGTEPPPPAGPSPESTEAAAPSVPVAPVSAPAPAPKSRVVPVAHAAPPPITGAPRGSGAHGSQAGRVVGFVAMGVGGAALLTGGVFGVLALRDEARLSARCAKDLCAPDQKSEIDSYESKKLVSGIGLISGALLGAGGAALFVLSSGSGPSGVARGGLYWAGKEAGVWGAF